MMSFFSMLFGVALFCGGILFERYCTFSFEEEEDSGTNEHIDHGYLKQWENLLNYDGNIKEEEHEDR